MSRLPKDIDGWRLVKPTMTDEAQERVTAVCGGDWWRYRIQVVGGGTPDTTGTPFVVVADPARYRTPEGEEIELHFDSSGALLRPNPHWDRITGRNNAAR